MTEFRNLYSSKDSLITSLQNRVADLQKQIEVERVDKEKVGAKLRELSEQNESINKDL